MNKQETIDLINSRIKANGNQEITGNILNGVLLEMLGQINDLTGDLSELTTADRTNLVAAINEIKNSQQDTGIQVFSGVVNPNYLPPVAYDVADFFNQVEPLTNDTIALWQYNGIRWFLVGGENSDSYLIEVGAISVVGNDVTYDYVKASIDGVVYETAAPTTINVPFADVGMTRKDKVVIKNNGTLLRVIGVETFGISVTPITPIGTVAVDILDVSDNSINSNPEEPVDPIVVDNGDTIATKIDITLTDLGVATIAEVTDAMVTNHINGLGLVKSRKEFYVVNVVEEVSPIEDINFDVEGDWEENGIVDGASFANRLGADSDTSVNFGSSVENFSLVNGRLKAKLVGISIMSLDNLGITIVHHISIIGLTYLEFGGNEIVRFNADMPLFAELTDFDISLNQISDWSLSEEFANSLQNGSTLIHTNNNPTSSEGTTFKSILESKGYTVIPE